MCFRPRKGIRGNKTLLEVRWGELDGCGVSVPVRGLEVTRPGFSNQLWFDLQIVGAKFPSP